MFNKINNITLDYQNGILLINGKKIADPIKVIIKEPDAWDLAKVFNPEMGKQGMVFPELVIDARDILAYLQSQRLKEIVYEAVKEAIPAELAGTAGKNC
ncbi:MAG: hypothetical protein HFH83_04430 [Lachnospiraceae bacterium]|jgi:hypothetical protein|nr:hypothetical protein [Lachnospiraceae bacterium]